MKQSTLTCDWCETELEVRDNEDPIELGWLSVEVYDIMKGEITDNDFCSKECLIAYFNE